MSVILSAKNISKSFGSVGTSGERVVLASLNLDISNGDFIAIIGRSGSGKSTLLNILGTLENPDSGCVEFKGLDISAFTSNQKEQYRRNNVGFVFQLHHLLPQLSLRDNILLPLLADQNPKTIEAMSFADIWIEKFGLTAVQHQKPDTLSGGECQRAALIRALIRKPDIILADEPTGALDKLNEDRMLSLLQEINRNLGTTVIVVTHNMNVAEGMHKIYELSQGKLLLKK